MILSMPLMSLRWRNNNSDNHSNNKNQYWLLNFLWKYLLGCGRFEENIWVYTIFRQGKILQLKKTPTIPYCLNPFQFIHPSDFWKHTRLQPLTWSLSSVLWWPTWLPSLVPHSLPSHQLELSTRQEWIVFFSPFTFFFKFSAVRHYNECVCHRHSVGGHFPLLRS